MTNQKSEIEKDLDAIKERLKQAENELTIERMAKMNKTNQSQNNNLNQLEEMKNKEIVYLKEEFKRTNDNLKKEIDDLTMKNANLERLLNSLQANFANQSHVGWMKDDIELEKDMALKQKQEIERLNSQVGLNNIKVDFF
jgi:hypothetical protein